MTHRPLGDGRRTSLLLGTACALAALPLLCVAAPAHAAPPRPSEVTVATFNIRFDFEEDAKTGNRWADRKQAVATTIINASPHIVGLQEDKDDQIVDLRALLPEHYAALGKGRTEAGHGEHCTILYDQRELTVAKNGDFWLSDTPNVPGSNTWGDYYPRKVTWAVLANRRNSMLLVLNAHMVEGKRQKYAELREKGAAAIVDWLCEFLQTQVPMKRRATFPIVLMGDFNSPADDADSAIYELFVTPKGKPGAAPPKLEFRDAWEKAVKSGWPGTYHGFEGTGTSSRIDWILYRGAAEVLEARKIEDQVDGRYPSDHYPLFVRFAFR